MPSIAFLFFTGIYLTLRLQVIQFRQFFSGWRLLFNNPGKEKGLSNFQILATTLSGTIGTGNIAGVATAIALGGPGALFWMWMTAILGMAIKYSSCTLAHRYRREHAGEIIGGPMITLEDGLGYKKLAMMFAFFTMCAAVTTGAMVQSNSIVSGLSYVLPKYDGLPLVAGGMTAGLFAVVVLGGLQRIAQVAGLVVPVMTIAYCGSAIIIVAMHAEQIPAVLSMVVNQALNPWAAGSGAILAALHYGVARALFASEAGLGTAPMAQSMVRSDESVHAGLVGMLGPFVDTLIICTLTALVLLLSGAYTDANLAQYQGAALSAFAFEQGLAPLGTKAATLGPLVVGFGLMFFAYTTLLAWSYYGGMCCQYLFGGSARIIFQWLMIALILIGAVVSLEIVWALADIANLGMVIPNLIAVLALSRQLVPTKNMSEQ